MECLDYIVCSPATRAPVAVLDVVPLPRAPAAMPVWPDAAVPSDHVL